MCLSETRTSHSYKMWTEVSSRYHIPYTLGYYLVIGVTKLFCIKKVLGGCIIYISVTEKWCTQSFRSNLPVQKITSFVPNHSLELELEAPKCNICCLIILIISIKVTIIWTP